MQIYLEKTGPDFILSSLEGFHLEETFADAAIVGLGRRFPIHRTLLAVVSPFLAPVLSNSDLVVFPEATTETLEAFLRLIYSGTTGEISPETHYELSKILRTIQATKITNGPLFEQKVSQKSVGKRSKPSAQITKRPSSGCESRRCFAESACKVQKSEKEKTVSHKPKKSDRKIVTKTYKEKYDIIKFFDAHPEMRKTELAKMFGLPLNTLSEILKKRYKIFDAVENSFSGRSSVKRVKRISYDTVDSALISWYHQESLLTDSQITKDALLQQARRFAMEFGFEEPHKVSRKWIERFKNRWGLTQSSKTSIHVPTQTEMPLNSS